MSENSLVNIVIGIPGYWQTKADMFNSFKRNGLLSIANTITDLDTGEKFELEIYEYDPELRHSFFYAGRQSLTESDLIAIDSHKYTIYLIGKGGSLESGQKMMNVCCQVLKAGGIAVKIESAGIAHSAKDWFSYANRKDISSLYSAYVTFITNTKAGLYYSCGMHNLGFPDVILSNKIDNFNRSKLSESFLLYLLNESPVLKTGDVFSENIESPLYELIYETCNTYPVDDLFYNPYGMWRLAPIQYI